MAIRFAGGHHRGNGPLALAAVLAIAAGMVAGCSGGPTPQQVAASFLADWGRQDWAGMRSLTAAAPADFASVNAAARSGLGVQRASYAGGHMQVSDKSATEPVTQHLMLAGIGTVTVASQLRLTKTKQGWRVAWTPSTIAPQLKAPTDRLTLHVSWPDRAQITGAGGAPLTTEAPMVVVGVEGQRIKQDSDVRAALLAAGAPAGATDAALAGAKQHPAWFEPVFTVTQARYDQIKPSIYPVPGTVFENVHQRVPLTPGLSDVVGSIGPVTAQELSALGAPYDSASVVGQTGLEGADERQLAGTPGATIAAVDENNLPLGTVASIAPRPGAPVQTSIDPAVQRAAEQALSGVRKQAGLVAVDASTGQVLAAANTGASGGFDLALDGALPPGSSFKVLTSTALISKGLTPSSPASCPPQVTVDGAMFHNAEGTGSAADLLQAFAESCNTAFIGLATRYLSAADFTSTAALYRLGSKPALGLTAFGGSVPAPSDQADLAATAIGQGRVEVSPLDMAMVAAAVDSGQVRAPRLVAGAADDSVAPAALPASVVGDLHTLMAQVVASGTAAGQGLPAGTYAKTGTAEYGTGNPLPTDAWLIGFNDQVLPGRHIAFAMVTVNGGEGGPTDGPVIAKFLKALS